MEEQRIGVWPATGLAPGIVQLQQNFGNMILNKFPKGFINSWHFDDKQNMKTGFVNTKVNILNNSAASQYTQQKKPRLTVVFNNTNANQEDAAGGIESPFTYPLVQGVHPEMNGYIPIYKDPNDIRIYMSHKRIRTTFQVIVEVESLGDQENVLNLVENLFKMQYGSFLEYFSTKFILPNDMINTIFKVLYAQELEQIKYLESEKQKKELYDGIGTEFYNTLHKYSSCNGISRYNRENNPNDNYFLYEQIYRKLYYEITTKPEKTDGEKIGSIFGKYTVTFDGFLEYEKPISYILVMPDVVAGSSVTQVLQSSGNIDYFRDFNPSGFMKYYKRRASLPKAVMYDMEGDEFQILYSETDISMESPNDVIDLPDWINTSEYADKLGIYAAFMKTLTKDNFNDYFHIHFYDNNDNTPVDQRDIFWDGEILHIGNTDSTTLYKMYVMCNKLKCAKEMKKYIDKAKLMEDKNAE